MAESRSASTLDRASTAPSAAATLSDSRHRTSAGSSCGQPPSPSTDTMVATLVPTTCRSALASWLMASSSDACWFHGGMLSTILWNNLYRSIERRQI